MTLPSLDPKLPGSGASKAGPRFVLELFVILCLTVCYFFLVRNFALGVGNNHTNHWVFTACSKSTYHLGGLYDVWKGRLSGMLLSGSLFDLSVEDGDYQIEQYAMLFGLYQAFWLLVLLLTMLVAVRESLLVNLGIFAGLLYNFTPVADFYFYPWDLPATVFLTLAVLLHERGHRVLMLAAIGVGCFFKETVLVGAILCLFNRGWKWRWRLLSFAGLAAIYILGKRYLMSALHLKTAVLAMGDSTNVGQLLRADYLIMNVKLLFSDQATQVLFANAGTLVAVLVLGWKRRFRPYLWMIVAYVVGQFMYGTFSEVRIFMQVLPLSCLILSEYAQGWTRRSARCRRTSSVRLQSGPTWQKGKGSCKCAEADRGNERARKGGERLGESKERRGFDFDGGGSDGDFQHRGGLGLLCAAGEPPTQVSGAGAGGVENQGGAGGGSGAV